MSKRHGPAPEDHDEDEESPSGRVRLDKWLWAARFFKTRALAADAVNGGKVDVNGDRAKRAKLLQIGDEVRLRNGPIEWQLCVTSIGARRGSATVAQELYEESAEGRARRERVSAELRAVSRAFSHGESRPGKQDRRAIRRLKGDA